MSTKPPTSQEIYGIYKDKNHTPETYFNSIKVQGLMISVEFELKLKKGSSIDDFLKSCKRLTKDFLIWVECPKCHREVPKIDMTKLGYCYLCYKEMDEKGWEGIGYLCYK